jgi:hypothetical protein
MGMKVAYFLKHHQIFCTCGIRKQRKLFFADYPNILRVFCKPLPIHSYSQKTKFWKQKTESAPLSVFCVLIVNSK